MMSRVTGGMTAAMLDRPIWSALRTAHRRIAVGPPYALRFPADMSPFCATFDDGPESLENVGRLLRASPDGATIMQVGQLVVPRTVRITQARKGVQMIAERDFRVSDQTGVVRLTERDAAAMVDLATRTRPGPFLARTNRLGRFWGVREGGQLIAMAGERLRQPGFTEISGVCVDPNHRGKGLASWLVSIVGGAIQARGERPYLHTYADNTPAISVYERLGFRLRTFVNLATVMHAATEAESREDSKPTRKVVELQT